MFHNFVMLLIFNNLSGLTICTVNIGCRGPGFHFRLDKFRKFTCKKLVLDRVFWVISPEVALGLIVSNHNRIPRVIGVIVGHIIFTFIRNYILFVYPNKATLRSLYRFYGHGWFCTLVLIECLRQVSDVVVYHIIIFIVFCHQNKFWLEPTIISFLNQRKRKKDTTYNKDWQNVNTKTSGSKKKLVITLEV